MIVAYWSSTHIVDEVFLTLICSTSNGTVSPFKMDNVADVMFLKHIERKKLSHCKSQSWIY